MSSPIWLSNFSKKFQKIAANRGRFVEKMWKIAVKIPKTEHIPNKNSLRQHIGSFVKNGNLEDNRGGKFPFFPKNFWKELTGVIFHFLEEFGGSTGVESSKFSKFF